MPVEIEIGKLGTHTDAHGISKGFTPEFFQELVSSYDPKKFIAPAIISHDTKGVQDDELADHPELSYGATQSLKVVGDRLKAVFNKVSPKIVSHFRNGELLSVSPSFYPPGHRNNPTPGKWSIRHVAFLGKTPPAIKGLTTPQFSETGFNPVEDCLEFSWEVQMSESNSVLEFMIGESPTKNLLRNLREWLIEKYGSETADKILPAQQLSLVDEEKDYIDEEFKNIHRRINNLKEQPQRGVQAPEFDSGDSPLPIATTSYQEENPVTKEELNDNYLDYMDDEEEDEDDEYMEDEDEDKNPAKKKKHHKKHKTTDMSETLEYSELQAKISELEYQLEETDRARKLQEVQLLNTARQVENERENRKCDRITAFSETLVKDGKLLASQVGQRVLSFGEEDESEMTLVDFMMSLDDQQLSFMEDFLTSHPTQIEYREFATDNETPQSKATALNFSAVPGAEIRESSLDEYQQVLNYCEQNSLDPDNPDDFEKAASAVLG